jgi:hypothetical protein
VRSKREIFYNAINLFGWHTTRKLLVFESDDWGGIRTPTKSTYDSLLASGIRMDANEYSQFDGFERKQEYDQLGEVLAEAKDARGRPAVFTLNMSVGNPDFDKIRSSGMKEYHFESFIDSYRKFGMRAEEGLFNGIREKLFYPQLHGREHMNIFMWMDLLNANRDIRTAFDRDCYALGFDNSKSIQIPYLASFAPYKDVEPLYEDILTSAQSIFQRTFGFKSETFIAPVYYYTRKIESALLDCGVKGIQGLYMHRDPDLNRKHWRFFNSFTKNGHVQLVRNCFFEPSSNSARDWIGQCLQEISIAFNRHKPALVSAHRLNFNGSLVPSNASNNLYLLRELLHKIIGKWPDVEFITSPELTQLILADHD